MTDKKLNCFNKGLLLVNDDENINSTCSYVLFLSTHSDDECVDDL